MPDDYNRKREVAILTERQFNYFKTRTTTRKKSTHLYIISNKYFPYFKVGVTCNIEDRLKGLSTAAPPDSYKVEYLKELENCIEIERKVHNYFNAENEWVKAPLEEILKVINYLKLT